MGFGNLNELDGFDDTALEMRHMKAKTQRTRLRGVDSSGKDEDGMEDEA
jgi:hypothetical protein